MPKVPKITKRVKLTDPFVRNLKPEPGTTLLFADALCPGLRIRVTPTSQTYQLWRRIRPTDKGPTGRAIGEVGTVTLDEARQTARGWIGLLKVGKDPAEVEAERLEAARQAKAAETAKAQNCVRAAWLLYEAAIDHHRSKGKTAQIFQAEILPALGDLPLPLTRPQVKACVRAIARRTVYQAYATFGTLRTFERWWRDETDFEGAVGTDGLKASRVVGKPRRHRSRVLTDDEIFAFWRATRPEHWGPFVDKNWRRIRGKMQRASTVYPNRASMARGCRVLLLTGGRLNEILEADRREVSPDGTILTVAAERFKSDEAHMVQLSAMAQGIIAELPRRNGTGFLFTDDGEHAGKIWSKDRRRIDRRMVLTLKALARLRGQDPKLVKLEPFVMHDLRRTCRTRLSQLKVPREISEMILGHGRKGLERVYDQFEFQDEQRGALEKWAAMLARIVDTKRIKGTVIDIASRRA